MLIFYLKKYFYKNGELKEFGNYKDNLIYGEWKYYKKKGELKKVIVYSD